jgi:cell wall-associated NlpC family hydrolase
MALAVVLLSSCSGASRYQPVAVVPAPGGPNRQEIVQTAKSFVGTPYRTGGTTRRGMDCSGLVIAVYRQFDIRLPRTSLDQSRVGMPVSRSRLKAGDLIFFKISRRRPVSHVGIYIGGGKFIHASTSARRVRVDKLDSTYFRQRFVVARRVVGG